MEGVKMTMTKAEHIDRHKALHAALDDLVADYLTHTGRGLAATSVLELIQWSHAQTVNPTPASAVLCWAWPVVCETCRHYGWPPGCNHAKPTP